MQRHPYRVHTGRSDLWSAPDVPSTVYLAPWPFVLLLSPPYNLSGRADAAGKSQIPSLAEGGYRAISAPGTLDMQALRSAGAATPRITLGRGEQKSIELKSR